LSHNYLVTDTAEHMLTGPRPPISTGQNSAV